MAGVNGIEIKVGQVWKQRDGQHVRIARREQTGCWGTVAHADHFAELADITDEGRCEVNTAYDLIELVQDENGFTIWRGGECPVPADAVVTVRFRNGDECIGGRTGAQWCWSEEGPFGIAAYKLIEQPASDPKDMAVDTLSDLGWHFDGTTWVQDGEADNERLRLTDIDMNERGYESLADVLQRAYDQAAKGKGKERHARGEPFDEQVMQQGAQRFGVGSLLFQAFKKSEESQRLPQDRAINELLGSIVYLAGAVIALEKGGTK